MTDTSIIPTPNGATASCHCGGGITYTWSNAAYSFTWCHDETGQVTCEGSTLFAVPRRRPSFLHRFRRINSERAAAWHGSDSVPWSLADWGNAAAGEMGEVCNVVKKIRRVETGVVGAQDPEIAVLDQMLADEIADTMTYLDLLAAERGIDVEQAIASKFNRISEREGVPHRLEV